MEDRRMGSERVETPDGGTILLPPDGALDTNSAADIAAAAIEDYIRLRDRRNEARDGWQRVMDRVKAVVEKCMAVLGIKKVEASTGYAYIQADGESVSYDSDALDDLCLANPVIREILWPHRTVRKRRGGLQIRRK